MTFAVENSDRPSVPLTQADLCAFRCTQTHDVSYRDYQFSTTLHFLILLSKGPPLSLELAMHRLKGVFSTLPGKSGLDSGQWDVNRGCSEEFLWVPEMRERLRAPFCPSVFPHSFALKPEHEDWSFSSRIAPWGNHVGGFLSQVWPGIKTKHSRLW